MGIDRATLNRGTAYLTYNGHNFETRDKLIYRCVPKYDTVTTSMHGDIDATKTDYVGKLVARLWGAWENLADIFPAYLMNPIRGTSVFGTADKPLGIQARNNDLITHKNAAVTGLAGLYLGTNEDLFAADVEFTYLIANGANPEDAGAYTTRGTNAYVAATEAFSKSNFKRTRYVGAWGAVAGFGSIIPQKGVQIGWAPKLEPFMVDGYGTVDMSVDSMIATAKCIPIGPTLAQIKAASQEEVAMGTLASANGFDLTWAGNNSGPVIVIKGAYIKENGASFDVAEHRNGEITWESTRGFTGGLPAIVASAT